MERSTYERCGRPRHSYRSEYIPPLSLKTFEYSCASPYKPDRGLHQLLKVVLIYRHEWPMGMAVRSDSALRSNIVLLFEAMIGSLEVCQSCDLVEVISVLFALVVLRWRFLFEVFHLSVPTLVSQPPATRKLCSPSSVERVCQVPVRCLDE